MTNDEAEILQSAKDGNIQRIREKIAIGIKPEFADEYGYTPLMVATYYGRLEIVRLLLSKFKSSLNTQDNDGYTALHIGILEAKTDCVLELINVGAELNTSTVQKATPLITASALGHLEIVQLLIDNGADINARGINGITALRCAVQHIETAKALIYAGADINAKTNDGDSVLMYAKRKGENDTVKLLLDHGATI
jgi:ankyrin repeat protein